MNITHVKQPSFIKRVNDKALIDELYLTKISDDDKQDVYIKKLIADVNIQVYCRKIEQEIFKNVFIKASFR